MLTRQEPSRSVFTWLVLTFPRARRICRRLHELSHMFSTAAEAIHNREGGLRRLPEKFFRQNPFPFILQANCRGKGFVDSEFHEHTHLHFGEDSFKPSDFGVDHPIKNLRRVCHAPSGSEAFVECFGGQWTERIVH